MIIDILSAGIGLDVAYVGNKNVTTREQESTKWTCRLTREGLEGKVFQ